MKKDENIMIRVSPLEKEGFERAAEIAGISLSSWARQRLRSASIKDLQEINEKIPFLKPIKLEEQDG